MTHRPPFPMLLVSAGLPLAITSGGTALMVAWLPELPDPIAVHWGLDGPDAFAPAWTSIVLYLVLGLGLPLLFGGLMFAGKAAGPTWIQKLLASVSLGVSVVLAVAFVGTFAVQRGLADASDAPDIGWLVIGGLAAGLLAGVIGWFIMPRIAPIPDELTVVAPLTLTQGERAVWIAKTKVPTAAVLAITLLMAVLVGVVTYVIVATGGEAWVLALVALIPLLAVVFTTSWRAQVDATGFVVRTTIGWPVFRVPIDEIERAGTTEVSPVADFGGWGPRWGTGRRFGVVTRAGEAIEVVRHDGRALVVTVDDAATGAALLAAYAAAPRPR